jgi:hypothetical protein
MRRAIRAVLGTAVGVIVLACAPIANAQPASGTEGFTAGYTDIGPVLGLGAIGDAGLAFGARFEHAIKPLPDVGDGVLALSVSLDHYQYTTPNGDFSYTPVGATLNYHFRLDDRRWDPFVGIGLGDYFVNEPSTCHGCSFNSGVYVIGRLGLRYFWTPKFAIYGDVGSGAGALHIGVMWKLKGGS